MFRIVISFFAACILLAGCSGENSFETNQGATEQLADYKGSWVVVNYWAIWCAPCRHEIPELNELHLEDNNIAVIGINWDNDTFEETLAYAERLDIQFVVSDTDITALMGFPRPEILPTTVLINPNGEIVDHLVGGQTKDSILQTIAKH